MRGETPSHTFFSDMRKKISAAQRTKFETADLFSFIEFMARPESQNAYVLIDSDTSYLRSIANHFKNQAADQRAENQDTIYVPVLYSPWDDAW